MNFAEVNEVLRWPNEPFPLTNWGMALWIATVWVVTTGLVALTAVLFQAYHQDHKLDKRR